MCVYTTVRIEDDVVKAEALTREFLQKYYGGGVSFNGLMGLGPAGAVADVLKRYEKAGVTDICIRFAGTDQLPQLEKFIRDVLPAFARRAASVRALQVRAPRLRQCGQRSCGAPLYRWSRG